jgi:DNA repair photolyase
MASPGWQGEHIAMGTNVDCYQRAEGRYQLMPGIIGALKDAANPFSILTKGTLILRDIDLLAEAAEITDVGLNVSVGFIDKELWRSIEPGTPAPARRLEACAALNERGLSCGVLMGPVVPFLSDSPAQLDAAVRQIAAAGATHVMPIVLHLRPGTRDWFLGWLGPSTPAWSAGTWSCTAGAPPPRPTRPRSPARSASSRTSTASAGRGHGRRPVPDRPRPGFRAARPRLSPASSEQLTLL